MIERLPKPIFYKVILNFSSHELHRMMRVSKFFLRTINNRNFWIQKIHLTKSEILRNHPEITELDTLLAAAAQLGLVDFMKAYLRKGANPHTKFYYNKYNDIYFQPIHFAAWSGNLACVKILVKKRVKYLPDGPVKFFNSALHFAAASGNPACVKYFLDAGISVNQQSRASPLGWNRTPLQIAVSFNRVRCYHLLRQHGADIHIEDPDEYQAIHQASGSGSFECVQLLIKDGADVNALNEDSISPLDCALKPDNFAVIKELVLHGANIRHTSSIIQKLPLQFVMTNRLYDIAALFLEHDPTVIDYVLTIEGQLIPFGHQTSLALMADSGDAAGIRFLLPYHPDPHILSFHQKTALDYAYKSQNEECIQLIYDYIIERDFNHYCIGPSQFIDFEELPRDVFYQIILVFDTQEIHRFMRVSQFFKERLNSENFWQLKLRSMALHYQRDYPTLNDQDALLIAASACGKINYINQFIANGANIHIILPNVRYRNSNLTPLHFAAYSGNIAAVKKLLEFDVTYLNTNWKEDVNHPIHFAVASGNSECVKLFLDAGVPVNLPCCVLPFCEFQSPLQIAIIFNKINCYKLLRSYSADLHYKDGDWYQPIHTACLYDSYELLKLLLQDGADPNASSEEGHTPLTIACKRNQVKIVSELLRNGANSRCLKSLFSNVLLLHELLEQENYQTAQVFLEFDPALIDYQLHAYHLKSSAKLSYSIIMGEKKPSKKMLERESWKESALHFIAKKGILNTIIFLIDFHPNPHLLFDGKTAYDIAIENHHFECAELIYSYTIEYDFYNSSTHCQGP